MPVTLLLIVAFSLGLNFPGVEGMLLIAILVPAFSMIAACWGAAIALRFRTQAAGPLIQSVMFILILFTASYAPLPLLAPWLEAVATINPVNQVIEGLRAPFIAEATWQETWPAVLAVIGLGVRFGASGIRRTAL